MATRPINSKREWETLPAGTTINGVMPGSNGRANVTLTRGPDEEPGAAATWESLWPGIIEITVVDTGPATTGQPA